jgi:enediyne biosynthesis protein E4
MRTAWLCLVLAVNVTRAQDPCVACHPREVEGYRRSAMATSLGRPALESRPDDPARLLNLGAALRAAVYLRRAHQHDPLLAEARELLQGVQDRDLATALYRERKFADAAAALEKHLALQPDDHNARLLLGLSLQQAGTLARAAEVLHEARRRRPRDASVHYYLARVDYLRGLLDAGEQSARRALELGEPPARVHNLLGLIRVEQGRNDEALALYADAIRADPSFSDGYIHAGVLLGKLGRSQESLDRLDQAVRLDPASAEARYQRARALIELGRADAALSDLEAAASNHDQARRLLQQFRAGGLAPRPPGGPRAVAPIRFRNAAESVGLRFTLENHATPRKHVVETMAGGVAAFDFNNDGRIDIFFTNGAHLPSLEKTSPRYWNRLFRNEGNMKFTDVTEQAVVAGRGYSMGVAAADFDNDGYVDLFVAGVNQNILYRNRGDGTFEDITAKTGLRSGLWSVAGGWFDYDRDGRLDLFVVNYLKWSPTAEPECLDVSGKLRVYCHPDRYQGLSNTLYRNRGDGTFEDVSTASGIAAHIGKGMSVAFADYDGDAFPDVFVANDTLPNFLFRNRGDGTFEEVGLQGGVGVNDDGRAVSSMGADFRDYDGDGLPDIVVTALTGETFPLFRNQGKGFFRDVTYPSQLGLLSFARSGWSVALVDFNNDGRRDLFSANSHVSDHLDTYRQPNSVFAGAGGGTFVDSSESLAASPAAHRGAAFADFNNDGRIDVVVTALGGQAELWENVSPEPHRWLRLRLEGTRSNRDGIGARVRVGAQHDYATTSVGYASSSAGGLHFGLARIENVGEIEIHWPSGTVQVLQNVRTNQILAVKENGANGKH